MDMALREGSETENITSLKNIYAQDQFIERLIGCKSFREKLLTRYGELLDTAFRPEELLSILNGMAGEIEPEIERQSQRWGNMTYESWQNQIEGIRQRLAVRADVVRGELIRYFKLDEQQQNTYFGTPVPAAK